MGREPEGHRDRWKIGEHAPHTRLAITDFVHHDADPDALFGERPLHQMVAADDRKVLRTNASGTAQAVLDHAPAHARLIFSSGWHITRDGKDVYSWLFLFLVSLAGWIAKLVRFGQIDDQVDACRRIFASDRRWTVVRGSALEEGVSQGLPVWSEHIGDPILRSNVTRRVDFASFMVDALTNPSLVREAPAIVGCQTASALAHARQIGSFAQT